MPYGPTKFVNGQNQGAAPVNTQVQGNDIQVIFPASFASAKAVLPDAGVAVTRHPRAARPRESGRSHASVAKGSGCPLSRA